MRSLLSNPWVRWALTVILVLTVIWKIQPGRLAGGLASASPVYIGIALLLTIPFLFLKALRWWYMLRAAGIEADFYEATRSLVGGMGVALLTPARLGELVRVAHIRDPQKLKIAGLVMIDKGFDVLALTALSVVGAWILVGTWAGMGLAVITIAGLVTVYYPAPIAAALRAGSRSAPMGARLLRVLESLDSLTPRTTTIFLGLTLLAFADVLAQFAIVLLSWRGWSPDVVFLTFPLVVLTNVLPVTIGGLGVREGAAAALLGHYGVSAADAALAAFLMFSINTALPGLVGAFLLPPAPSRAQESTSAK